MFAATALSLFMFPALATQRVEVPAGSFQMGCSVNDSACDKDEGPAGGTSVQVPAFLLDVHEVSVGEYQRCMDAGKCTRPKDHA